MSHLASILKLGHRSTPKVLGVRLREFCVGHALALHRLDNPVISGGDVTVPDLIEAVTICSQSPIEAVKTINSPFRLLLIKLWSFRIRKMNLVVEMLKFEKWIQSSIDAPEVLSSGDKKPKRLVMPWIERLVIAILNLGISEETALNMSVSDAERFVMAHAEMHGQVELWSDEQNALWEYAASHRN